MKKIFVFAGRHHNSTHESSVARQFGLDVEFLCEDWKWGNDPVAVFRKNLEVLCGQDFKIVGVAPTGRDESLIPIVEASEELGVTCYRAIFARDEENRVKTLPGGDGRDMVIDHWARMVVTVVKAVRTVEDLPWQR